MLKKIDDDNHSENVEDSFSDDNNSSDPIVKLDLSLNNGKKATLCIYEGDNINKKVNEFCKFHKISPRDEKILLQKVKEELETISQNDDTIQNNNHLTNTTKEYNNNNNISPKNMDYIAKEKNKLDHILNESESRSLTESLRESENDLENLIKEYKSDSIDKIYNDTESSESKRSTKNNIKNNNNLNANNNINKNINNNIINNNINKNINNNLINKNLNNNSTNIINSNSYVNRNPIIFNNNSLLNQSKINYVNSYNNLTNGTKINNTVIAPNANYKILSNTQPQIYYQVQSPVITTYNPNSNNSLIYTTNSLYNTNNLKKYTNSSNISSLSNTSNLNYIENKNINKYSSQVYTPKNNQILYNNPAYKLNNTYQNINNQQNSIINLGLTNNNKPKESYYINSNSNKKQSQPSPFINLVNQKIEFIDYKTNNKNNYSNKVTPIVQPVKYKVVQNEDNNIIHNVKNEKESIIYGYQPNETISQFNNNLNNKGESIIYNVEPNKVNVNDSIVYNFNPKDINNSKYSSLNNTNTKIEYATLGNKVNNQKNDIVTNLNNNATNNAYNNYNNINNKENNNYIINNQSKQTTINYDNVLNNELKDFQNNINEQTYNNNDTINNQITEYIKDSVNSQILEFNKNESISNPIIDYKEQNSQFTIYENLPQNAENNNINNQNIEYSIQNNLNSQNNKYSIKGDLNSQNKEYTIKNNLNEPKNDYIIYDTASIDNNTLQSQLTNEYANYNTKINNNNLQTQYTSQYTNQIENITNLNNNNSIEKSNSFINNKDQNQDTKSININNDKNTENNNINMSNNSNNKYISNVAYNIQENKTNNSINNNIENENNINQISIDPQINMKSNTNENEQLEPSTISKNSSHSFVNNKIITKKIESNYQSPKKNEQEGAKEKNKNVIRTDPMDSSKRRQREFKNNSKNNSLYNSKVIKEDDSSEIKNAEKKKTINEKVEIEIINNNDNNGGDLIEEKEPQDNCKKKRKLNSELPKDSDDLNYKESQTQYDNISSTSNKNKVSNESNNNAIITHEISYHENSSTKNNPEKNIGKINNTKNNNNISNYNSYNSIINEEELSNSLNYSNTKNKNSDIKDLLDMSSNNNKKEENINKSSINDNINNFTNNESENIDSNSLGYEKMNNYLDKELGMKKPKYKKKDYTESNSHINSNKNNSSYNYNNKNNTNNKIYTKKIEINQQKINPKKKPMKVLTFKKNEFNTNNINKRSNSSGNSKTKFGGVRLYEQYMNKLNKKSEMDKRLLNERLEEENKEIYFMPNIDANSRRIVERLRNNEENKVEDRLINYGFNKKQKHLIQHANNDVRNKTKSPFRPKIDSNSRIIANKNKKNRINETINIMEDKKRKRNFKKIDLEKEFGKRNRSIGNEHRNKNSFINFEEAKSSNNMNKINIINNINNNNYMFKNKNPFKNPNNNKNENNYNINTYRNSKNDNNIILDDNKTTMSQLNKTLDFNNAYRELYNSIDEKNDSEITKFFGNCITESILTDNNIINTQVKTKSNLSDIKNKNIHNEDRRALTPQTNKNNYNTFDYLFYESEKIGEKNRKKQELNFRRNHPFKPKISPRAKQLKNRETTNEFINRISKNLEEIKIINSSNRARGNRKSKYILIEQNSKHDFRPKITRGPKSPKQRDINVNLEGYYDKRITKERKDLQRLKTEEEKERKNVYNQKSKDIIMKMKYKKYRELFNLLDSNQDGFISSTKIKLTKIDENVLRNISPILEELNQSKRQMDFKEFCIKIDKLMTEKKLEQNK